MPNAFNQSAIVSGGSGFIGSHLLKSLASQGYGILNFDNRPCISADIPSVLGDIVDFPRVQSEFESFSFAFHQAAMVSVPESMANPRLCQEINATGTLNVLLAAQYSEIRRVVVASSSAIYGNDTSTPKRETMLPAPVSPYAASKLAAESLCQVFSHAFGLETVALRYFNVYGPGQSASSPYAAVIPKFIETILAGRTPVIYGDGNQTRDFIFVDDVVHANLLAGHRPGIGGEVFNIGSGTQLSLNDLLETIAGILGITPRADYRPARAGDVRHSVADIDKARSLLGFAPAVSLEDGLRRTVEWFTSVP